MRYRVVLQGCTLNGADADDVKKAFMALTGQPSNVTERLFGGAPRVIKRGVDSAVAERLAGKLRAIGAAATVEPELAVADLAVVVEQAPAPKASRLSLVPADEPSASRVASIKDLPAPASSVPPLVPTLTLVETAPMTGASEPDRPSDPATDSDAPANDPVPARTRDPHRMLVAAAIAAGVGIVALLGYSALGSHAADVPASAPVVTAAAKPASESVSAPAAPAFVPADLHGSWRCTDQSTGSATFWAYQRDGTLTFYGANDPFNGEKRLTGADVPSGWTLDGNRLSWTYAERAPVTHEVLQLSRARLDYNAKGDVIVRCRRP